MQLEKINFLKEVDNIEIIKKGHSGAYKYLITKGKKRYFLKIGNFNISKDLEKIFNNNNISHPTIFDSGKYDDEMNYIIEEYIDGKNLKEELDNLDNKFIYEYGFEIGSQYKKLRTLYPDKPMDEEKIKQYLIKLNKYTNNLEKLIEKNKNKLIKNNINFLKKTISYLNNNTSIIKNSFLIFGHTDIKPSNFLIHNKNIMAIDIEHTDYKELSLSMLWSFSRNDFKDEKNLAFTSGYINALFNFEIPENVLAAFNYTYLFNVTKYFIKCLENENYDKLSRFIKHINKNYIIKGKLKISEKIKGIIDIKQFRMLNGYDISLKKGSFNSNNLTFRCKKNENDYFLKIMKMSFKQYKKAIHSYEILKKSNIPFSTIVDYGCLLKNECYYIISKFIDIKEMDKNIQNTFLDGFNSGQLVASYLINLKHKNLKNAKLYDKKKLVKDMMKEVEKIYGKNEYTKYIYWAKQNVINYIEKYSNFFDKEPINLIHGDVKFGNILYNCNDIYFVDNESLQYSYDIINFMYNIHMGFYKKDNLLYKSFVNGYLKYMNNGKIPLRIQYQAKLLLIYYILRKISSILDNKSDEKKLKFLEKSLKYYIDKDCEIEWLK